MSGDGTHRAAALEPELRALLDAQRDERIFVELASVRSSEIVATTADAIENAARPDQLRFGIAVRQGDDEGDRLLRARRDDPRFSIEFHPPTDDANRQWRRHRAQAFYDGEPFILQIDGDARFAPGWDSHCVELLAAVGVERPLLTDAPLPRRRPGTAPPTLAPGVRDQVAPHRFTVGRFALDVPHDPEERGDDIRLAVRAYTHGYDALFPTVPLVLRTDADRPPDPPDDRDLAVADVVAGLVRSPIGGTHGLGSRRTAAALERLIRPR